MSKNVLQSISCVYRLSIENSSSDSFCFCLLHVDMMTVGTDMMVIVDMIMDLPDGVHMTDPHLEVIMTPTWTDALLEETTTVTEVTHTEVEVLEDRLQGTANIFLINCCKDFPVSCILTQLHRFWG